MIGPVEGGRAKAGGARTDLAGHPAGPTRPWADAGTGVPTSPSP